MPLAGAPPVLWVSSTRAETFQAAISKKKEDSPAPGAEAALLAVVAVAALTIAPRRRR